MIPNTFININFTFKAMKTYEKVSKEKNLQSSNIDFLIFVHKNVKIYKNIN